MRPIAFFNFLVLLSPVTSFTPSAPKITELSVTKTSLDLSKKVFIDGEAGTTGLQVRDRLSERSDIEIISPPTQLRKDTETRKKFINEADAVILCKCLHINSSCENSFLF